MADLIFNPLLKKGFQYDNTAAIQAEIDAMQETLNALQTSLNALQKQKITKCFTAADLAKLEINEIFEWQGDNTIFEGTELINGYFYKYIPSETITITPPKIYYTIDNDIVTNLVTIKSGIFYQNGGTSAHGIVRYNSNTERFFWVYDEQESPAMPHVGELVFDAQNMIFSEIVSVQGDFDSVTDNLGNVFTFSDFSTGSGGGTQFNFISSDGLYNYDIANQSDFAWFFIKINGKEAVIVSPRLNTHYTDKPIIITIGGIQQTDTQPRLQNIENASNGDINITQNLNVSGDLNVTGTQRIVHTEEIDSENDFINLRYNNPLALANDEQSGIKVENYDGNNNNCIFGVDNAGWARIGDEGGTLQKLATIQETPTDGAFVKYNNTTKELESTTDGSALTVTFTPDTSATINHINSGDTLAAIAQKISKLLVITPSFVASVSNPTRLLCILFNNVLFIQAYELQFIEGLSDFAKICSFPQSLILSQEYNYGIYANTTTNNYVNTIYVSYSSVENSCFISIRGSVGVNQSISFNMIAI